MIEETMDRLTPQTLTRFDEVLEHNRVHRRWDGLVLTGAEVTLRRDLADLARRARDGGFRHVRIQTHGMRLADQAYCRELVEAGIDEYFVSVTSGDAETHDAITGVPGSFERTLQGLENLDRYPDVVTITNTVVTRRSYVHLPAVVKRLGHLRRLVEMDFWGYWPMGETDPKDLLVSHVEAAPYLQNAVRLAGDLGRAVEVKNFPECLLGDDREALENHQPKLLIDPDFWKEFHRNGFDQCIHRPTCESRRCLGLNTAYVTKFGWQTESLVPIVLPRMAMAEVLKEDLTLGTHG